MALGSGLLALPLFAQTTNIGGGQGINSPASSSGGSGCTTNGTSLLKGNGLGGCATAQAGTDFAPPSPTGFSLLKANNAGGFQAATPAVDFAPATTGNSILKGNGAGAFTNAISGTDYAPATSGSSLLKGDAAGGFANAVLGTDYAPATSGSSLLKGNGSGGFLNAASGTDYAPAPPGSLNAPLFSNGGGGFMAGSRTGNSIQVVTASGSIANGDIAIGDAFGNLKDGGAPSPNTQINLCTIGGTTSGSAQVFEYVSSQSKRVVVSYTNYANTSGTPQNCPLNANGGSVFTQSFAVTTQSEPYATVPLGSPPTSINLPYNMGSNPAPINGQTFEMVGS